MECGCGLDGWFYKRIECHEPSRIRLMSALQEARRDPLIWRVPMNAVVFEHAPVLELPGKWRARLARSGDALMTVRIEEEAPAAPADDFTINDPAFGIRDSARP